MVPPAASVDRHYFQRVVGVVPEGESVVPIVAGRAGEFGLGDEGYAALVAAVMSYISGLMLQPAAGGSVAVVYRRYGESLEAGDGAGGFVALVVPGGYGYFSWSRMGA